MRLHLPTLTRWLNDQSTLERCRFCSAFDFETTRSRASDSVYLSCKCRSLPRLLLVKMDIEQRTNVDLNSILVKWIRAKRNCWNKLVRYFSISNKNW